MAALIIYILPFVVAVLLMVFLLFIMRSLRRMLVAHMSAVLSHRDVLCQDYEVPSITTGNLYCGSHILANIIALAWCAFVVWPAWDVWTGSG